MGGGKPLVINQCNDFADGAAEALLAVREAVNGRKSALTAEVAEMEGQLAECRAAGDEFPKNAREYGEAARRREATGTALAQLEGGASPEVRLSAAQPGGRDRWWRRARDSAKPRACRCGRGRRRARSTAASALNAGA